MRNDSINATLDLEGLHVVAAAVTDELTELVIESRLDAGCLGGTKTRSRVRPGPIQATQGAAP